MRARRIAVSFVLSSVTALGCERPGPVVAEPEAIIVMVAVPVERPVTDHEDFTGTMTAVRSVDVRSQVTGYLVRKLFNDGEDVRQGELLYDIDPRPFKYALDQASANVAQSKAHLGRLESEYLRAKRLSDRGAIGTEELGRIAGTYEEARAAVGVALARQETARIELEYTRIQAPMGGQLGRSMIDPGNVVLAGTTPMVDIVFSGRLYFNFDVPESTMIRIRSLLGEGSMSSVQVHVGLSDEEGFSYRGTVDFSESKVDAATGTLRLRGVLDNPSPSILIPGLFVRVRLPIGEPHATLLVPQAAVGTDQGHSFVYVVDGANRAEYRRVAQGPAYDGLCAIRDGLKSGERVIVQGLQYLRPGVKVSPKFSETATYRSQAGRSA